MSLSLSLPLEASRFYGVKGSGRWVRGGGGGGGVVARCRGRLSFLSVGTCAVLAPCLREARSCLVAAWCRGGCCPRGPTPGDFVLLLLATRAPYSLAVLLANHHPTGECGRPLVGLRGWREPARPKFLAHLPWRLLLPNGTRLRLSPNPPNPRPRTPLRLRPTPYPPTYRKTAEGAHPFGPEY